MRLWLIDCIFRLLRNAELFRFGPLTANAGITLHFGGKLSTRVFGQLSGYMCRREGVFADTS